MSHDRRTAITELAEDEADRMAEEALADATDARLFADETDIVAEDKAIDADVWIEARAALAESAAAFAVDEADVA